MTSTREQVINRLLALPKEIESAESDLIRVQQNLINAQDDLKVAEGELLSSGTIDGKNVEIRTAQLHQMTHGLRDTVSNYEAALPDYRKLLNRAQNEFAAYRNVARILSKDDD
jgi:cob(I)alamin adenosyltransferase